MLSPTIYPEKCLYPWNRSSGEHGPLQTITYINCVSALIRRMLAKKNMYFELAVLLHTLYFLKTHITIFLARGLSIGA